MIEVRDLLKVIRVTPAVEDKHFNAMDFISVWDYFQFYINLEKKDVGLIPFVEEKDPDTK